MEPLDLFWHLLNFFAVALGLGVVAAAVAKLLWWRRLGRIALRRLMGAACISSVVMLLLGLVVFGRDGRVATYGLMVLATTLALWWVGFRSR